MSLETSLASSVDPGQSGEQIKRVFDDNYVPNFKEVERAYWFGPVHGSVRCAHMRSRTVRDRILKFDKLSNHEI